MSARALPPPTAPLRLAALAAAGPALAGATVAMHDGLAVAAWIGLGLPLLIAAVACLMLPALYIGSAFIGVAPPLREVARAAGLALADLGRLMLAFTPALAFLVATSTHRFETGLHAHLALLGAAFFALRAMYGRLAPRDAGPFGPRQLAGFLLFATWSCITLAIGWRFFIPLLFG
ncbi:MAG: hypothetical protein H6744_01050 [Deltaproteobacteria bacterium]|nr:hypothetical protein [Deltaproteobacteria bacterium]MCB9785254.1 hypothetical protein [Deltaproteobacteria bacterium]